MSLNPIFVSPSEVSFFKYSSSLKTDYAAAVGSVTVYSISQFAINQLLLIGEYGSEGSELIKTHAATEPTGYTVTFASNTAKAHQKDTKIYILSFDQIEFSHADTLTGSKTVLATTTIDPEEETMLYEDTSNTSGYYFTRYKNSITSTYSDYSDGIPYSGLPKNTVGYAIDTAMNELGAKFSERLTFGMLIEFSKQMLQLVRGKMRSWSQYRVYDQNFGTVSQGVRRWAIPSDVYDQTSNKSILSLRLGNSTPLLPVDKSEYIETTEDVRYTEVATEGAVGAISLVLDDTSDLDDEGSIDVYVSGTKYTIEYTDNTKSTNTLTIDSDQITVALPVDSQVWQNAEEGTPEYFSIRDGYVYIWPAISSEFEGQNLTGDYLTDIEDIDSQMDVIKGNYYFMLLHYLKWKIKAVLDNSGKEDMSDPSYVQFRELLNDNVRNNPGEEHLAFRPRRRVVEGGRASLSRR